MKKIKEYSVVMLMVEKNGFSEGTEGTIVHIYRKNGIEIAYEVEIDNDKGETIAMLDLLPSEFQVIWEPIDNN